MRAARDNRVLVHATSIVPGAASAPFGAKVDAVVLLFGNSGSGKSDVALRLVAMGAHVVADDQTELFADAGRLFAEAPAKLAGHMEIRGIGIVKLTPCGPAPVLFCVNLINEREPRWPEVESYAPDGLDISDAPRLFRLNGFDASTPAKIAAAAAALQLQSILPADGTFF